MSGIKNKLQRLLPVRQWKHRAEGVHKQAANLNPKSVPTGPQDPSPLVMWGPSSARAALWDHNTGLHDTAVLKHEEEKKILLTALIPG